MDKIVEATKTNNQAYAKMYATELAEIRKNNKTVSNAKLSMEQVQIRLNTVSELGDVVVTLSPCMSLIKGLSTSLGGMMPEVAESMQDLSSMLGDIATGTTVTNEGTMGEFTTSNKEAQSILDEAQAMVEGQTRQSMPEPPVSGNSVEDILRERDSHISAHTNSPAFNICLVAVFEFAAAIFCTPTKERSSGILPSLASFKPVVSLIICK